MNVGLNSAGRMGELSEGGALLRILAIDDDQDHLFILETILRRIDGFNLEIHGHTNPAEALDALGRHGIDVILVDYDLKSTLATNFILDIRQRGHRQPVIVLTGVGSESVATRVMKIGATDYIVKADLSPEVLRVAIDSALSRLRLEMEKAMLERELLESQKMEAIGTLVGGIALDFNNLLTVLLAEAEIGLLHSKDEGVNAHLKRIQETGLNMAAVVRRIAAFDQVSLADTEPHYLGQTVDDACDFIQRLLPKVIQITTDVGPGCTKLAADGSRIRQILVNLSLNAADAMPSGGEITITVATRQEGCPEDSRLPEHLIGNHVLLVFRDTGGGIPEEIRPRIFEPFFTTKEFSNKKGTGLGLSMVWQLVQAMRGKILVESQVGVGTTFKIFLPAATRADSVVSLPGGAEPKAREGESVLVVDRNPMVRDATATILKGLGYAVETAETGAAAVATMSSSDSVPSVVLLGFPLADMSEIDFIYRIKELAHSVPVLAASGNPSAIASVEAVEALCAGPIVPKPFHSKTLGKRIRDAIDS